MIKYNVLDAIVVELDAWIEFIDEAQQIVDDVFDSRRKFALIDPLPSVWTEDVLIGCPMVVFGKCHMDAVLELCADVE